MGIKAETVRPRDPANGPVWLSIIGNVDHPNAIDEFISVIDTARSVLSTHPWSIAGGGASEMKEFLGADSHTLNSVVESIGIASFTLEDEVFIRPFSTFKRYGLDPALLRKIVVGDDLRDWGSAERSMVLFPYDEDFNPIRLADRPSAYILMWPYRTNLANSKLFGSKTKIDVGMEWWEFGRLTDNKLRTPLSIAFAFVATHNHFVLARGGEVFNRTAPIIKLHADAGESEHLGVMGVLNSSVGCFWLKQVCHNRGGGGIGGGLATERWEQFMEFSATSMADFPLPNELPTDASSDLDMWAKRRISLLPASVAKAELPSKDALAAARLRIVSNFEESIAKQEELDWCCYHLFRLTEQSLGHTNPPGLKLGERAFEIVLARRMAAGLEETTWFERHCSKPVTELPVHWPDDYRAIVEQRIALVESDRNISLIERPEYKRRWNIEPWEKQQQRALRDWLLDRLETEQYWPRGKALQLRSVFQLSDAARSDPDFMQVAALYAGRDDFDVGKLVGELAESETVPFLAAWRYTDDGLRKREVWEQTWTLQRQEDAVDERIATATPRKPDEPDDEYRKRLAAVQRAARLEEVGEVPVPPKYKSSDFRPGAHWGLRGALDVPKERFVSYPGATPDADGTLLLGWAGWDHLQQATALAGHYIQMKENEGWEAARLIPLLAGLPELVPWLKQWHNEWNAEHDARMGDYFEGFVQDETRALGVSLESLQAWRPITAARRTRRKA